MQTRGRGATPPPTGPEFPAITRILSTDYPKKQSEYAPRLYPDLELGPGDPRNSPWPILARLLQEGSNPTQTIYPHIELGLDESSEKDPESEPEPEPARSLYPNLDCLLDELAEQDETFNPPPKGHESNQLHE